MKAHSPKNSLLGYSLADVLVACAVLGIGVAASSKLTLTMNTQEEMSWRVSRGLSMVENVTALYQMGIAPDDALVLMPTDSNSVLSVLSDSGAYLTTADADLFIHLLESNETPSAPNNDLIMKAASFRISIDSVPDTETWDEGEWTGGSNSATLVYERILDIKAYRSNLQIRNNE